MINKILILIFILISMLFAQPSTLLNNDFEDWTTGNADNWTKSQAEDYEETGTPYGESGSSVLIVGAAGNSGLYQAAVSTAGDSVKYSFVYKNTNDEESRFAIYDITNDGFIKSYTTLAYQTSWTAYSYSFLVPSGCTSISYSVRSTNVADSSYFDEVYNTVIGSSYYVDADKGSDSNSGTAMDRAWATIAAVNSFTHFKAGDIVYLRTGDTWREQLTVPSSGSEGLPITFTQYDSTGESGAKPKISGADAADTDGITWTNVSGNKWYALGISTAPKIVMFRDTLGIDTTSSPVVDEEKEWFWTTAGDDTLFVYSADTTNIEYGQRDYGFRIWQKNYITVNGITTQYANNTGISFTGGAGSGIIGNIATNCTTRYNYQYGFMEYSATHANTSTVSYLVAEGNGDVGIACLKLSVGTTISNCTVYDNGNSDNFTTGAGIKVLTGTADASNIIIENNICYNNGTETTGIGGGGIHLDSPLDSCIVRYNKSYNNDTYGINIEITKHNQVYYNEVYGNTTAGIGLSAKNDTNKVYNNTCYNNGIGIKVLGAQPLSADDMVGNVIKNNICFDNTTREFSATYGGENDGTYGSGNVYQYNMFGEAASNFIEWGTGEYVSTYAVFDDSVGSATNSVAGDPLFTNAAGADFTLTANSPAIDAGVDVSLVLDYAGNVVPLPAGTNPDIGAYEYNQSTGYEVRFRCFPDFPKFKRH